MKPDEIRSSSRDLWKRMAGIGLFDFLPVNHRLSASQMNRVARDPLSPAPG
jgi:hypothetical protein